jgi:adenylate cyclase class 2
MSHPIEFEARWINQDRNAIEQKLKALGATKVADYFFREWIFHHPEWLPLNKRIRVRTDGKQTWMTYKANATWAVDSTEEVELTVSSAELAVAFVQAAGVPLVRYQEKKRTQYLSDGITFDLDTWPQIPFVIEIEASSEQRVKDGASLVGLSWADAVFEDQKVMHKKYFDIDLDALADYRFS